MEVRTSKRAQRDIIDASIRWRTTHSTNVDLFDYEVDKALDLLSDNPQMGRATKQHKNGRVLVLPALGFLLFYRIHPTYLMVLAVVLGRTQRAKR